MSGPPDKPNGRYRLTDSGDDEPPTRPGTPVAKLTPAAGTIVDGPVTKAFLRAELAAFFRDVIEAVKTAIDDGHHSRDADFERRLSDLERHARGEMPTLTDGL